MSNRNFRLSPRRFSPKQQLPLISSSNNSIHHGISSSNWRETSASHDFFLTDPVPLPPVLTQQAEESFQFMDRNRSSKMSSNANTNTNTNTSTRRLLSKMFLRKQTAKTNSDAYSYTTHSTTHSPLKSKATVAAAAGFLQVPFGSRSNNNHDSSNNSKTHSHSNSTTLGLSRDATRVLRPSQQKRMQMRRQQSAPDLVGSVLVLPKRIDCDSVAADIADTDEEGHKQHGLNHGISKDEKKLTEIPLQSPPSPRRLSRIAATTTTTTTAPSPTRRRLQFQLTKWQQSFRTGTPLSPSSVTATIETNAVEKTTLTRNDEPYQCQPGRVSMAADDIKLDERKYETDPPQSPFNPTCTRKSVPFDVSAEKPSFSSLQPEPSVEMACSGDLEDGGEERETSVHHLSVSADCGNPWRSVPCSFCTSTLYCANDADDLLVFCSECYGASPVRADNTFDAPTRTPSTPFR
jgi:hypothetical protein